MSGIAVSVLMAVHNGERYIAECVESVVSQTLPDWELVIVDDASSDRTREILRRWSDDPRITVRVGDGHQGLPLALNQGLGICRGALVARLDADDWCLPHRLERQAAELHNRPSVGAVGSSALLADENGRVFGSRNVPDAPAAVLRRLRWRNAVIHPSCMFRRELVNAVGGYREECGRYEDYDLWLRIAAVAEIANINEPLIAYRVHSGQITKRRVFSRVSVREISRTRHHLAAARGESQVAASLRQICWAIGQSRHESARAMRRR